MDSTAVADHFSRSLGRTNATLSVVVLLRKVVLALCILAAVGYLVLTMGFAWLQLSDYAMQTLLTCVAVFLALSMFQGRLAKSANALALRQVEAEIYRFRQGLSTPE